MLVFHLHMPQIMGGGIPPRHRDLILATGRANRPGLLRHIINYLFESSSIPNKMHCTTAAMSL